MSINDVRVLVLDVDGVLTDGRLFYGADGDVIKTFHARDGLGLELLARAGIPCALLSGRDSAGLRRRAADLGIERLVTGCREKGAGLRELTAAMGLTPGQAGMVGDDLVDLPAMRLATWTACPADAVVEVRRAADFVARLPGGGGAVREIIEHLLRAQLRWDGLLASFTGGTGG
jgi:3-deoxy-D-manno-octulosonate 8-phosphate phosphatase (KDO 8-P phosphatase)